MFHGWVNIMSNRKKANINAHYSWNNFPISITKQIKIFKKIIKSALMSTY